MRLPATPTAGFWCRSREAASPRTGTHRATRAFSNWPKRATFRSAGRAGVVCVTVVRAVWFRERWPTRQSRSTDPLKAIFSFAVHNRLVMLLSICEAGPCRNLRCFFSPTQIDIRPNAASDIRQPSYPRAILKSATVFYLLWWRQLCEPKAVLRRRPRTCTVIHVVGGLPANLHHRMEIYDESYR